MKRAIPFILAFLSIVYMGLIIQNLPSEFEELQLIGKLKVGTYCLALFNVLILTIFRRVDG